jgi:hypothetical protein
MLHYGNYNCLAYTDMFQSKGITYALILASAKIDKQIHCNLIDTE